MPEATPTERANALIDWAERDGQRMGNEERRLIVEYAEAVDNTDKVIALINELCEPWLRNAARPCGRAGKKPD